MRNVGDDLARARDVGDEEGVVYEHVGAPGEYRAAAPQGALRHGDDGDAAGTNLAHGLKVHLRDEQSRAHHVVGVQARKSGSD